MILWRISNYTDLSGRGGLVAPGRWHEKGIPVVYCSDHPSTTLLEILVQIDVDEIPKNFQLLRIKCPDDLPVFDTTADQTGFDEVQFTRALGSKLLEKEDICLIRVPSAILPAAYNILLNPRHARAAEIVIDDVKSYPFDSRLLKSTT